MSFDSALPRPIDESGSGGNAPHAQQLKTGTKPCEMFYSRPCRCLADCEVAFEFSHLLPRRTVVQDRLVHRRTLQQQHQVTSLHRSVNFPRGKRR